MEACAHFDGNNTVEASRIKFVVNNIPGDHFDIGDVSTSGLRFNM